jgi:chorismate dehydratase
MHSDIIHEINLSMDIPSECGKKLINRKADIGEVPVAALPDIPNAQIITDYCIGAGHHVKTVLFISNLPQNKLKRIYLDAESMTSNWLARIFAHKFWNINVEWKTQKINNPDKLLSDDAGVIVIGDKAFQIKENQYAYQYDLAEEWKKHTGLPFVFACWITNRSLEPKWIDRFNNALKSGLNNIDKAIHMQEYTKNHYQVIFKYLTENISFHFDDNKKRAMELFLQYKKEISEKT